MSSPLSEGQDNKLAKMQSEEAPTTSEVVSGPVTEGQDNEQAKVQSEEAPTTSEVIPGPIPECHEDEFDIGELHVSKCARVHGVVTSVSPMKLSESGKSRYFDGELSDGKRKVRVVGFDSKVREKLFDSHGKREPVVVSNCEVKCGKYSSDLEIFVKESTELQVTNKIRYNRQYVCYR